MDNIRTGLGIFVWINWKINHPYEWSKISLNTDHRGHCGLRSPPRNCCRGFWIRKRCRRRSSTSSRTSRDRLRIRCFWFLDKRLWTENGTRNGFSNEFNTIRTSITVLLPTKINAACISTELLIIYPPPDDTGSDESHTKYRYAYL